MGYMNIKRDTAWKRSQANVCTLRRAVFQVDIHEN